MPFSYLPPAPTLWLDAVRSFLSSRRLSCFRLRCASSCFFFGLNFFVSRHGLLDLVLRVLEFSKSWICFLRNDSLFCRFATRLFPPRRFPSSSSIDSRLESQPWPSSGPSSCFRQLPKFFVNVSREPLLHVDQPHQDFGVHSLNP